MIEELQDCAVLSGVDQFQEINDYGYNIEKIVDKITDLSWVPTVTGWVLLLCLERRPYVSGF